MPRDTTTKTKVSTQTRVVIAIGILLLLGLGAYGFGLAPGLRRVPRVVPKQGRQPLPEAARPATGNLRISLDASTPIRQILVMGHTEKEIARFKLEADDVEDIDVAKIIISDSMLGGAPAATGTLRNLKLVNAATGQQIGSTVASLDAAVNPKTGTAFFDNLNGVTVPRNSSLAIKVTTDVTTYDAGGVSSSTHRVMIMPDYTGRGSEGVVATGRTSGLTIIGNSLDFNNTAGYSNTDADVQANSNDVFRTKITVSLAPDSPSGPATGGSEQTVAKFVVTNSMNDGSYAATLKLMNLDIGSTINNVAPRAIKIYKDSVNVGNRLATVSRDGNFGDTSWADGDFTDVEIVGNANSDSTRTFLVTMDTTDAAADTRVTVGLDFGDLIWSDGVTSAITYVESLPVVGRTVSY